MSADSGSATDRRGLRVRVPVGHVAEVRSATGREMRLAVASEAAQSRTARAHRAPWEATNARRHSAVAGPRLLLLA
jgi:hypothetical protein